MRVLPPLILVALAACAWWLTRPPAAPPAPRAPGAQEGLEPAPTPRLIDASVGDPVPWLTVGPTFLIETVLPPDRRSSDFEVELVSAHPTMALSSMALSSMALSSGALSPGLRPAGPLRESGDALWFRHAAPIRDPGPWTLVLRSTDHLFAGAAPFECPEGRITVPVELRALGALLLTASDEGGAVEDARVALRLLDRGETATQRYSLARGRRDVHGLTPGRYGLEGHSPRHLPIERTVLVVAGEVTRAELVLTRLPPGSDVTGTVASPGGSYHSPTRVELYDPGTGEALLGVAVDWVQAPGGARWRGTFRLADVPAGEWELRPAASTWHRFSPATRSRSLYARVPLEKDGR